MKNNFSYLISQKTVLFFSCHILLPVVNQPQQEGPRPASGPSIKTSRAQAKVMKTCVSGGSLLSEESRQSESGPLWVIGLFLLWPKCAPSACRLPDGSFPFVLSSGGVEGKLGQGLFQKKTVWFKAQKKKSPPLLSSRLRDQGNLGAEWQLSE